MSRQLCLGRSVARFALRRSGLAMVLGLQVTLRTLPVLGQEAGSQKERPAEPVIAVEPAAPPGSGGALPDEGEPVPLAPGENAADAAPAGSPAQASTAPPVLTHDELEAAGYMPGYRRHLSLGGSIHSPPVGARPGGITPSYAAPGRATDWTFNWAGSMSATAQYSMDQRHGERAPGQSVTVLHAPPQTIDEYASFTSTNSVPGSWVGMNFSYGNPKVSAVVSVDTWNPTRPTTYYQLGSQWFINNSFLAFTLPTLGGVRLSSRVGHFNSGYGLLGQYTGGMYVNPLIGNLRAVGETSTGEVDLSESVVLVLEHGIAGTRNGRPPDQVYPQASNSWNRSIWPGSWIHHAHAGVDIRGDLEIRARLHYIHNWSAEDRTRGTEDNPGTRGIDESRSVDGSIDVVGVDAKLISGAFGYLGVAGAYIRGRQSYPLKGLETFGGDGEQLTERWWGVSSSGTGKLWVAGLNYVVSLGKAVSYPDEFSGNGPDIVLGTAFQIARARTELARFDGRVRHKYGLDGLYTFMRNLGVGLRVDRVVPNSHDKSETFHVLAPRLQFKSDWNSHEAIQLMYVKWFYGSGTRNEGTGERTMERLDDQLVALNFNMWW